MRSRRLQCAVAVALLFLPVIGHAQVPPAQRDALIALYNTTNGPGWTTRTNWLGNAGTECNWSGVQCDVQGKTVTKLLLDGNDLRGQIPPQIGDLTDLTEIGLSFNYLSGSLPSQIERLMQLKTLDVRFNSLNGPLPSGFGNLKALRYIDLSFNEMEGSLPESLLGMTGLALFDITFDNFEGRVPDFTALGNLQYLAIGNNRGLDATVVFSKIGLLSKLFYLDLSNCNLSPPIPFDQLLQLPLQHLGLGFNHFGGTVPRELTQLSKLQELDVAANQYDTIPDEILAMSSLQTLYLSFNKFSGPVPSFDRLTNLHLLSISGNQYSGPFPANLPPTMQLIFVDWNHLSGPLPDVSRFRDLTVFEASGNDFSGPIPAAFGDLPLLFSLYLDSNRLTGSVPPQLGRASKMLGLNLSNNALGGEVPPEFTQMQRLGFLRINNNMLRASDPTVATFLDAHNPGWLKTQTLPPTSLAATGLAAFAASFAWDRMLNTSGPGGVQISVSTTHGGPYVPLAMTSSKDATSVLVSGLQPSTQYFAIAKAVTFANALQANTLFSDPSGEVSFTTKAAVASPAEIAAITLPDTITQEPGVSGGTSSYRIANIGGSATNVTLTQNGDFFAQTPSTFALPAGAAQVVTLTGLAKPENLFTGESIADAGAAGKLSIPVRLLSAPSSATGAQLSLSTRRIDLVSTPSDPTSGNFAATNIGDAPFIGVVSADVEWISAPATLLRIAPGQTANVTLIVDPTKRPDPSLLTGTVTGTVSLVEVRRFFGKDKIPTDAGATAATVSVSLTTALVPGASSIPPLQPGQVAYFLPGVGHVQGVVGLFLSDLSLLNATGTRPVDDLKLYYTSLLGGASPLLASVSSIPAAQSVFVGNIVKNVFRGEAEVGSLQIRSNQWEQLAISANVLNVSNPAGTYGTSIPVFRSDRAAGMDDIVWLSGLQKTATSYTNLFIQETAGSAGSMAIDFIDENGTLLASRQEDLGAFQLRQINDVVPSAAVMARLTGKTAGMRFHAYATPVDRLSGDNWSVADWARQYNYDPFEPVVIPIAGATAGAAGTNFRTDLSITSTNGECPPSSQSTRRCGRNDILLTYHVRGGGAIDRSITLEPLQTKLLDDIADNTFGAAGTVGWILVTPANGSLAVTSRTYNLVPDTGATFGSAVSTIAVSRALRSGQTERFAGIDDGTTADVTAQRPATYRNNIGIVEVLGLPAQVRLTLSYLDSRGGKVAASIVAQKDFALDANQTLLMPLTSTILGASRDTLGTLRNLRVDVQVISATGGVLTYISTVDNGTGDSIIRTE